MKRIYKIIPVILFVVLALVLVSSERLPRENEDPYYNTLIRYLNVSHTENGTDKKGLNQSFENVNITGILNISQFTNLNHSLNDSYNDGSVVLIDSTDIKWQMDGKIFAVLDQSDSNTFFRFTPGASAEFRVEGMRFLITNSTGLNKDILDISKDGVGIQIGDTAKDVDINIYGNYIPRTDDLYELGSISSRIRVIHVSNETNSTGNVVLTDASAITTNDAFSSPDVVFRGFYDSGNGETITVSSKEIRLKNFLESASRTGEYRLAFLDNSYNEFVTFEGDTQRVGIGITNPSSLLDVAGTINGSALNLTDDISFHSD